MNAAKNGPPLGELVASALRDEEMPAGSWPEFAFLGRSNAGKSSLINRLARRPIARTSQTPGKTIRIHFYAMTGWYLVDLPGFGYAKVSRKERAAFGEAVEAYLTTRRALLGGVLIQDCRRDPEPEEGMVVDWATASNRYLVIVANKMDKLNRAEQAARREKLEDFYGRPVHLISAKTGEGLDAVRSAVSAVGLKLP